MKKVNRFLLVMLSTAALGLTSCTKMHVDTPQQYLKWLNNPENGLVKSKSVNGMLVKVKYLTPEYLCYQEIRRGGEFSEKKKDSILSLYRSSLTFLMTIGPDQEKEGKKEDVMKKGIDNYQSYTERFYSMNFNMEDFVQLKMGESKYKPVLSSMENTYGIGQSRDIMIVFSPSSLKDNGFLSSKELDFVYNDEIFEVGKCHFVFDRSDLKSAPDFPFAAIQERKNQAGL